MGLSMRKSRSLSPEGRERLRAAALKHKPWTHSTGPQTAAGRAQAAANGKRRQKGVISVRDAGAKWPTFWKWSNR